MFLYKCVKIVHFLIYKTPTSFSDELPFKQKADVPLYVLVGILHI